MKNLKQNMQICCIYNEAVDISLKEIEAMKAVDEPLWEELDRKREEYIRIHGEVELVDDE